MHLCSQKNVVSELQTFLAIVFLEIGLYWTIRKKICNDYKSARVATMKRTEEAIIFGDKYSNLKLIDLCICDDFGQTLYHVATTFDNSNIFHIFTKLDSNVSKYKNKLGKTASDEAIKLGQWSIVQQISLAKMGSGMKSKAKNEEKRIEARRGIVSQFLKQRKIMLNRDNSDRDLLLEELLLTMLKLIDIKAPISDDMLLLVWNYEMRKHPTKLENRLWNMLESTVKDILTKPKNKRNWVWFSKYLLNSVIWYEIIPYVNGGILTDLTDEKIGDTSGDDTTGDDNSENRNDFTRIEINCDCGCPMQLNAALRMYKSGTVQCNGCRKRMYGYIFHCPKNNTKEHPTGFDLCSKCGSSRGKPKNKSKSKSNSNGRSVMSSSNLSRNINGAFLYRNLTDIANKALINEKLKLKRIIDSITSNPKSLRFWKMMIKFKQDKDDVGAADLRQDCKKWLTFPNTLGFDVKKLEKLKLKDYGSSIYMSNLLIVANSLNWKFHEIMKNDILAKDFDCEYHAGPIKTMERMQLKSEIKYGNKKYPNSSQILDVVRCQCVYNSCESLMKGIKNVISRVNSGLTPIKKVMRIKNLYVDDEMNFLCVFRLFFF